MAHTLKKEGSEGGMVVKVDLKKAYDRLERSFIKETLNDVGLPEAMMGMIMTCISSAAFRLLWNGESIDYNPTIMRSKTRRPYLPMLLCFA